MTTLQKLQTELNGGHHLDPADAKRVLALVREARKVYWRLERNLEVKIIPFCDALCDLGVPFPIEEAE